MSSNFRGALMVAGVGVALFVISAAALSRLLPGPHNEKDYFIIGCLSTLVALVAVFVLVITTWAKPLTPFFTRRKRTGTKMFDV